MVLPVLVFGYGNLSRGDDALGPLLLDYIEKHVNLQDIEILADFQLQIEHALDLANRTLVLFVDASVSGTNAYNFYELAPARDSSYTSHAMSPASVMAVYQNIKQQAPPPCFLLSIKGEAFELGEGLSKNAETNLTQAAQFAERLLRLQDLKSWRDLASHA